MRARDRRCVPAIVVAAAVLVGSGASAIAQENIPVADRISVQLGAAQEKLYDASRVARHYLGYAVLAARAYDRYGVNGKKELTPNLEDEAKVPSAFRQIKPVSSISVGRQIWTLAGGREGCATTDNCWSQSGLGVHFWRRGGGRAGGRCTEVVIAFRGTHGTLGSVFSNVAPLSVFVRILMPGADHYEQVRLNVDNWVKELRNYGCQNARIVAVGHSLGGGLAKHAAYQNSRISRVYTFNTSPVTAWGFIDEERRARNVKGLEIENIVERGEILGWARGPATLRYPARSCDPQERTITMDADTTSWAWGQHGIWPMAAKLQEWESRKRGTRRSEAGLPRLTAQEKAKLNCITESRERYMARNDPDWIAERRAGPTVTVRVTPPALRER
jgi:pimeloyl-ACP methyl ester carboxylesterase